ncbi:hypothetical protein GYH30_007017 [Glycine max]|uniref:Uncharacterized protein n=1 Tax=Glycine max TaxID=3847 RepID=A0A0R0KI44_SOYBN|nr:hypothetical protein GYH30_007017 [Glycine max]
MINQKAFDLEVQIKYERNVWKKKRVNFENLYSMYFLNFLCDLICVCLIPRSERPLILIIRKVLGIQTSFC